MELKKNMIWAARPPKEIEQEMIDYCIEHKLTKTEFISVALAAFFGYEYIPPKRARLIKIQDKVKEMIDTSLKSEEEQNEIDN